MNSEEVENSSVEEESPGSNQSTEQSEPSSDTEKKENSVENLEHHGFQTEVRQLMDLVTHSLYSNKEIFLRELISNASDACDKLRFEALSNDGLYESDSELSIEVEYNKEARTITVRDNGIGMGKQEVIENLGTIAKSGTKEFFTKLTGDQTKDSQLIGQFGVGFYSSFIVAERVVVRSRMAGQIAEGGVEWQSAGEGDFTIGYKTLDRRGTEVVLHLKQGEDEFLNADRIKTIINKYSEHIAFPIQMLTDAEGGSFETINSATAMWQKHKRELKDDEYISFYKSSCHDFEDPLTWIHNRVEGTTEYVSLLFIPKRAPFDIWDRERRKGISLYIKRVFITDAAEQLMPSYLRFVRGLVDASDLPLNVSREMLQNNKSINKIRSANVKRVLDALVKLAKNKDEDYQTFYKEFGKIIKEGLVEDSANKDQIVELLRFCSTHDDEGVSKVKLQDYVDRMQDGQKTIYFLTADNLTTARNSPHLEIFQSKGIEVLLLTDEIDEWVVRELPEYQSFSLQSVTRGKLDIDGEQEQEKQDDDAEFKEQDSVDEAHKALIEQIQSLLKDKVKNVRVTNRLVESPACLVDDEEALGGRLERILKTAGHAIPAAQRILEINPEHPMLKRLSDSEEDSVQKDWATLIFEQAILSEGGKLEDPGLFVKRMNKLFNTSE